MQAIEKNGQIKVIVASDRKTKVTITFSDNGPGIPIHTVVETFERNIRLFADWLAVFSG